MRRILRYGQGIRIGPEVDNLPPFILLGNISQPGNDSGFSYRPEGNGVFDKYALDFVLDTCVFGKNFKIYLAR